MPFFTPSVRRGMEGTSADLHKVFPPRKHWIVQGYPNGVPAQDVTPIVDAPREFFVYHTAVRLPTSYRAELVQILSSARLVEWPYPLHMVSTPRRQMTHISSERKQVLRVLQMSQVLECILSIYSPFCDMCRVGSLEQRSRNKRRYYEKFRRTFATCRMKRQSEILFVFSVKMFSRCWIWWAIGLWKC